ncbi:MAG: hypothetical protein ACFB10_13130 [Salibacteraceae bacterium]
MKAFLAVLSAVFVNIVLVILSILIYGKLADPLLRRMEEPSVIFGIIGLSLMVLGLLFFTISAKFRVYSIGLISFAYSASLWLLLLVNQTFSMSHSFISLRSVKAHQFGNNPCRLSLDFEERYVLTPVTLNNCAAVDSVDVLVKHGLLGYNILTDSVVILPGVNCSLEQKDPAQTYESHLELGHVYSKKRCFEKANYHYSKCIELAPYLTRPYLHRGLMQLIRQDYHEAQLDFATAFALPYETSAQEIPVPIDRHYMLRKARKIITNLELPDYGVVLSRKDDFVHESALERLEFCRARLNAR